MDLPLLHVVFGDSVGGILRQGLRKARLREEILSFPDNLAYGPISDDPCTRVAWCQGQFDGLKNRQLIYPSVSDLADFWDRFDQAKSRKVIWVSRRSSREFCGLLECIHQSDANDSILINDLTDQLISRKTTDSITSVPIHSTGHLDVENMMRFYGNCEVLRPELRESFVEEWKPLREENRHYRVFAGSKLISAPNSHFDESILLNLNEKWRKASRVIGETLQDHWISYYNDVGFEALLVRLNELINDNQIVGRGDCTDLGLLEVRRLPKEQSCL